MAAASRAAASTIVTASPTAFSIGENASHVSVWMRADGEAQQLADEPRDADDERGRRGRR